MTAAEKLHQLIQTLPEDQINEVLHFAEFLHQKQLTATQPKAVPSDDPPDDPLPNLQSNTKRAHAIQQMRGLLKTDQPAPTDQEVATLLEQRRTEKYLA